MFMMNEEIIIYRYDWAASEIVHVKGTKRGPMALEEAKGQIKELRAKDTSEQWRPLLHQIEKNLIVLESEDSGAEYGGG